MSKNRPDGHRPWLASVLWQRICFMWFQKMAATSIGITVFFWLYFAVMNSPWRQPLEIPALAVDRWIPVSDWMVVPYGSLWLYISLSMALLGSRREVHAFMLAAASMVVAGLTVFWFLPTFTPVTTINHEHRPWLAFLRTTDRSGNALPSLHVSFALFSALLVDQQLRLIRAPKTWRFFNLVWCLSIIYSTVATKQHVTIDVIGGIVFGILFWNVHLFQLPQWHLFKQRVRRQIHDF